jgi:hypothetical protein
MMFEFILKDLEFPELTCEKNNLSGFLDIIFDVIKSYPCEISREEIFEIFEKNIRLFIQKIYKIHHNCSKFYGKDFLFKVSEKK